MFPPGNALLKDLSNRYCDFGNRSTCSTRVLFEIEISAVKFYNIINYYYFFFFSFSFSMHDYGAWRLFTTTIHFFIFFCVCQIHYFFIIVQYKHKIKNVFIINTSWHRARQKAIIRRWCSHAIFVVCRYLTLPSSCADVK